MKIKDNPAPSRWISAVKSKIQAVWHTVKPYMRPSAWLRAVKKHSVLVCTFASLFAVYITALTVMHLLGVIPGKSQTATCFSDYTMALQDGTDIVITGVVAQADIHKRITLNYTLGGNPVTKEVNHKNGVFETRIYVGPAQMGDMVQAELWVNGRIADSMKTSVRSYALSVLEDDSAPKTLKVLVSDMLRYGYETQLYLGQEQEAEDLLRDVPLLDGTPYQTPTGVYATEGEGEVNIQDILLVPTNMLALCFTTDVTEEDGYNVDEEGNLYINNIPISSFFKPIQVGIYKDDTPASAKITYSVADYVKGSENTALEGMMRALYSYAMSVHLHFGCSFDQRIQGATCQNEGLLTKDCDCGAHEEEILPIREDTHETIQVVYPDDTSVQYTCEACHSTWTSTHTAWQTDAAIADRLTGYDDNQNFTENGERLPMIDSDGTLSWTRQEDSDTATDEFHLTVSLTDAAHAPSYKEEESRAYISLRIKKIGEPVLPNAPDTTDPLRILLIEQDNGTSLWAADWYIYEPLIRVNDEGVLLGWEGVDLGQFTDEWTQICVVITFEEGIDEETEETIDLIRATYYVGGEGRGTGTARCTTKNGSVNALHILTYTDTEGTGMAMDDIVFAH